MYEFATVLCQQRISVCFRHLRRHNNDAGWSSLVARQAHNLKVAGSNPAPATNFLEECCVSSFSFVPKRRLPCTNGEARVCSASPKAIQRSSVVERSAVNRLVVGSNPTAGAPGAPVCRDQMIQSYFS